MDTHANELTIRGYVAQIRNRLERAVGIARAADACAGAGFYDKAVEIMLDLELPLCEATTLVNATSEVSRTKPHWNWRLILPLARAPLMRSAGFWQCRQERRFDQEQSS